MFLIFFLFIIFQRLGELSIAKNNERWMKENGALEFGENHYGYMVFMHIAFLVCFLLEVLVFAKTIHPLWPVIVILFMVTQGLRIWAITSLGRYWNTKILVVPSATIVRKGPYRFLRHPNYLIVGLEIFLIPVLFQAYITAALFTILNVWMLSVRIPIEEKALSHTASDYSDYILEKSRFTPKFNKNID
ncbi:isoprenylcysteine carboxyl methyltransferase family protein [Sutcliffiella halmapala]|uniref:isoprenylcysteine carboxyl methyltransferase family protein n=1 Tax=Sutcliffiella halmapala TaxID=79882 RepID=UPI000995CEAE|nr:isoprenylcysteine carboxylmethyltransferase family protein [Sutcliffiella halmapala]